MESVILDSIPALLDQNKILQALHLELQSGYTAQAKRLLSKAKTIAKPKAAYRMCFVQDRGSDFLVVEDVTFQSRVLAVNTQKANRIFVYIATCGKEIEAWSNQLTDPLECFWADTVKRRYLELAMEFTNAEICRNHELGQTSTMSPGALNDWPIEEQRKLFQVMERPAACIGVELTPSCLMLPTKSVSGIRFPTEIRFESCQLCPRQDCPSRRAPYEHGLYASRYKHCGPK